MNSSKKVTTSTKRGGNLAKQMSDLAVPFGLILAKQSLESFLKKEQKKSQDKPQDKKVSAKKESKSTKSLDKKVKTVKKVSLSGGNTCGSVSSSATKISGFTQDKKYASV